MQSYTRGATVTIAVTFRDADGNVTNPPGASAFLQYLGATTMAITQAEIDLVKNGDTWSAVWDSRAAAAGVVRGHARSDTPLPLSAVDFEFELTANAANPAV